MTAIVLNTENKFVKLLLSRHRSVVQIQLDAAAEIDYLLPIILSTKGVARATAEKELHAWKESLADASSKTLRLITIERRLGITYGHDTECKTLPAFEKTEITVEEMLLVMFEALLDAQLAPSQLVARPRSHEACTHS